MLYLAALFVSLFIVFFCDEALKKRPYLFCITGSIITIAVITVSQLVTNHTITIESEFVTKYLIGIFSKGAFAGALWSVVMWAGALPTGSALIKKIMPIRGELSIFAAAITLSHAVTYSITYIKRFMLNMEHDRPLTSDFIITSLVCIVLMIIMIPLTVMSFKVIRKKMNAKTWKKIQRAAYIFYALIYIHIMVLYVPQAKNGNTEKFFSIIVYSIVFIGYAVFKIAKVYIKKNKPQKTGFVYAACSAAVLLLTTGAGITAYGKAPERKIPEKQPETSAVTTTVSTESPTENNTTVLTSAETTTVSSENENNETTAVTSSENNVTSAADTKISEEKSTVQEKKEEDTVTTAAPEQSEKNDTPENNEQNKEENKDENQEENKNESQENKPEENQENNDTPVQEEPQPEPQPEPEYIYNNGTFEGTAFGYAGDIHVTITIENDVITSISASADADADDGDYYFDAEAYVLQQIRDNNSADNIDACSGATFSSEGLINAAKQALASAKK